MYIFGQPVLRKHAEDIPLDYPGLQQLISDMFETMKNAEGVGLAAPQVGLSIRVVVVDLDVLKEDYPGRQSGQGPVLPGCDSCTP